ncbi:hypothetical protein CORC01_10557 [Colletotrichum orchidophilum]|uniref:Uncharacterized protein n=1 Tax=Colletotrichum orchidophilum TaxID=1209926 RepID=A0A1G4AY59_9PEZI|nr:uncharacterized protein CORC01_10557 [Colletotrichum orchidophilum]OHE94100.1 hypothetical protein CORC01_10557 [Colletotrichum orchidophilum]
MQLQSFLAIGLVAVTGVNSLKVGVRDAVVAGSPASPEPRAAVADLPDIIIKRDELSNSELVAADLEEAGDLERRTLAETDDDVKEVKVKRGDQAAEEFFAEDLPGSDE